MGFISISLIVLAAMPLCCNKLMDKTKPISIVAILLGLFTVIMPAIGAGMAASGTVEDQCDCFEENGGVCNPEVKKAWKGLLTALGTLAAYTAALGFIPLICGIVAASLGMAICCKCCNLKDQPQAAQAVVVMTNPTPVMATGVVVQAKTM